VQNFSHPHYHFI